jgi:hypothetical protein
MRTNKLVVLLASAAVSVALLSPVLVRAQAAPAAQASTILDGKKWIGHEAEIEDYLRNVEIVSTSATGEGVTHPQKCTLPPGGPSAFLAFKPIPPGPQNGAMESYKSEIAAYEIDKILQLHMVPPVVEKVYKKQKGAAVFWIMNTKNFNAFHTNGGAPTAPPDKTEYWNIQLTRAKMFDSLIGNMDPNLGNWLVDDDWDLFIIDHSRSLFGDTTFVHEKTINHIDSELWAKMQALTLEDLTAKLSMWMSKGDIKSIIQRRDLLGKKIADLVKKNGEANVFIKYPH